MVVIDLEPVKDD